MLRNRFFLIGLGCGLIAGAVFLQLMMNADKVQNKTSETGSASLLTQEQLQQEASRLNMKVIPKEQQAYTQQQIDEIKQKAVTEEKNQAAKASPTPTTTPISQATAAPTSVPKEKTVFIPDRMDATSVANLLVQNQVISEPTKLLGLLVEQKLTEKIRYGNHTFPDQTEVNEIVRIITSNP